jgi:hypothetical protein
VLCAAAESPAASFAAGLLPHPMSAAVIMIASEILRIFLIILTSYAGAHPRYVSTYHGSAVFIFAKAKTVREYVVQAAAKLLCGITVCYHKRFPSFLSIVGDACMRGKGEAEETGGRGRFCVSFSPRK